MAADNKFAPAIVDFPGAPDFAPTRIWNPGAKGFPPEKFQPGSVGDAAYSPFIRIVGSDVVYNAPIVATGDGPFDFVHHTNTQDHVVALDSTPDYNEDGPEVTMALAHGFDSGRPILYLSTEASDAVAATLERATYVPLLANAPFRGGDDFHGFGARTDLRRCQRSPRSSGEAVRQRCVRRPSRRASPTFLSTASYPKTSHRLNSAEIRTSNNIQGDFPLRAQPRHEFSYSPLWEAQVGEWTAQAIAQGKVKQLNDENQMLEVVKSGLMTGPMGVKFGGSRDSSSIVLPLPISIEAPLKDTTDDRFSANSVGTAQSSASAVRSPGPQSRSRRAQLIFEGHPQQYRTHSTCTD